MITKISRRQLIVLSFIICHISFSVALTSCKHVDEEPKLNEGYATDYRVPDAEPMTAEDSAVVAAQQEEYNLNAK